MSIQLVPVTDYMSRNLELGELEMPVDLLARTMHGRGISALPIVDKEGSLVGVVSRTDLIALGALNAGRRWTSPTMSLPHRRAKDVMTSNPQVVASTATLQQAARIMIDHAIHRVFVMDGRTLSGVISATDLAAAVRDARIETPLSAVMTTPIVTIDVHAPLSAAIELLDQVHVTGLIVTEAGLPIGMFTQLDALASRDLPRGTPVETTYDAAVICLPDQTKLHRAAAHAAQLDVRRVLACRAGEAVGIVSGLDFARVVAGALA